MSAPIRSFRRARAGRAPDLVDVDQALRTGEPEVQQRDEALSAGEHLGLVAVLGEQRERVLERGGDDIFEGAGFMALGCKQSKYGSVLRGERRPKYEAPPAQVKKSSWSGPSEIPMGVCKAPMVVVAHLISWHA